MNSWLREYVGKPGRKSSEQEKERKQHFFALPQEEIEKTTQQNVVHPPSAQEEAEKDILLEEPLASPGNLSWLLVQDQECLDQQERHTLAFILQEPDVSRAYTLAQQFVGMVRKRQGEQLDTWLLSYLESEIPDIQTFAEELQKEYDPVKAALTFPYSNGPVEGQINKLKFIKHSVFGRGSFELLRQRVLMDSDVLNMSFSDQAYSSYE